MNRKECKEQSRKDKRKNEQRLYKKECDLAVKEHKKEEIVLGLGCLSMVVVGAIIITHIVLTIINK
jgi:hypothetical protein